MTEKWIKVQSWGKLQAKAFQKWVGGRGPMLQKLPLLKVYDQDSITDFFILITYVVNPYLS